MESVVEPTTAETPAPPKVSRTKWIMFALGCLLFFTLLKLPTVKIKNYVQGTLTSELQKMGVHFSAKKSSLGLGFGISYELSDVSVTLPGKSNPIKLDYLEINPSLLPLLMGKFGGDVYLESGKGEADFTFAYQPDGDFSVNYSLDNMDLGHLKILENMAQIKGSAILNGTGEVEGNMKSPDKMAGDIFVKIENLKLPAQKVVMSLPKIDIGQSIIKLRLYKGRVNIKTLKVGTKNSDSVRADITGDITLDRAMLRSKLNLKVSLALSDAVQAALPAFLLDQFLGKPTDGTRTFRLSGPLTSPFPTAVTSGN